MVTSEIARTIMEQRRSRPFASIEELKSFSGMTDEIFEKLSPFIAVRSDTFRVDSTGRLDNSNMQKQILAIVDRSSPPAKIKYWGEF
ncbi:MAG: hypothetical protein COS84_02810 [Armatimonadetes bacterium CG07_land_8_20_14_0_80_40_9]|nr:MAG: hypothetical protein COS84_02810 [Armatimonadetes bacterium CG07_land_8_20_14_0_80_40_9]